MIPSGMAGIITSTLLMILLSAISRINKLIASHIKPTIIKGLSCIYLSFRSSHSHQHINASSIDHNIQNKCFIPRRIVNLNVTRMDESLYSSIR